MTYMPKAISGYQNLDELNQKFYGIAFRVTAAETLDLPGAIETYTHVELGRKARALYDQMAVSFIAELETGEKITAANALTRLLRFQQLTSGFAATPDGKIIEVDKAKANALADILDGLPRREPVVIFVRFQNDLDTIARIAGKMKRPHYEISGRVKNLDEWNTHGGVLAVQIQAGGLGLDLTASRYCVYYSLGFSLGGLPAEHCPATPARADQHGGLHPPGGRRIHRRDHHWRPGQQGGRGQPDPGNQGPHQRKSPA